MATRGSSSSSARSSPSDVFRQLQDLGSRLSGAARSMAEEFAKSPAGQLAEPMAQWGERMVELSTLWVAPVRAVLEEQQQLIDAVASWAEEQRKLADRFSELAERHRQLTDQVMAALTPVLDQAERLAGRPTKKTSAARKS